jgi:hypothetical protein
LVNCLSLPLGEANGLRRRTRYLFGASAFTAVVLAIFLLPLIPVQLVELPCPRCGGSPFYHVGGYSSLGYYFSSYGAVLLDRLPIDPQVGYCVFYGDYSTQNTCGIGLGRD